MYRVIEQNRMRITESRHLLQLSDDQSRLLRYLVLTHYATLLLYYCAKSALFPTDTIPREPHFEIVYLSLK